MSVIDDAGILAISTRLLRLSEQIRKDGLEIYKACGIEFEPKWFPVIYALHKKSVLGVVEPRDPADLDVSHPHEDGTRGVGRRELCTTGSRPGRGDRRGGR